jgi:putative endonuclease
VPDPRHLLGLRAEDATAAWLTGRGWTILGRRWRCPEGEIDIVAIDADAVLVAVEVKLRSTDRSGDPLESVDRGRLRRLRAALGRFGESPECTTHEGLRIDLVAVRRVDGDLWQLSRHPAIAAW